MYDIFTFGAEYIDRRESKRYLNNIENYELYVLLSNTILEYGKQMFSKSNLYNSIALPKVIISKRYYCKLGEEDINTDFFTVDDERLGIQLSETNIDKLNETVFIPYEIYFPEDYPDYNPGVTFNIRDYKDKILIVVPRIDDYDNWRIFKAGERHKFFVAYFNFESLSDEETAYYWIIAKNNEYDIIKNDIFYMDSEITGKQDYNTALGFFGTQIDIGGDWNTIENKPQKPQTPIIESIIEINDKMYIVIKFNDDINIDYFELQNKIGVDGDWGLCGKIENDLELTPDEQGYKKFKVIDDTFQKKDTVYYRIRAFNSIEFSNWDVNFKISTNLAYIDSDSFNVEKSVNGFNLTWKNVNTKLLEKNIVYVEIKEVDSNWNIDNAEVVYEGTQNSFNYLIKYEASSPEKVDYFYKFWVVAKTRGVE